MSKYFLIVIIVIMILMLTIINLSQGTINKNKKNDLENESNEYYEYLMKNNFDPTSEQHYQEELQLCEQYIQENPKHIYAIYKRGFLNLMLGNIDLATKDYLVLLNQYPTNTKFITDYVDCYIIQHKTEEALNILESYYKDIKKDAHYYGHKGRIYHDLGNLDLSIENYKKAEELDPNLYKHELEAVSIIANRHKKEN